MLNRIEVFIRVKTFKVKNYKKRNDLKNIGGRKR